MSDPMKAKGIIVVEDWIDESVLGAWHFFTWEEIVAAVHAGVDVGAIEGRVVEWCETHGDRAYISPSACHMGVDSGDYGECSIVSRTLLGPVSDGGSET